MRLRRSIPVLATLWLAVLAWGAGFGEVKRLRTPTETLEGVTVLSVTADSVTFRHAGGIRQLPLESLVPEDRVALGYDPEAAKRAREIREAERLSRMEKEKARATQARGEAPFLGPVERAMRRFGEPARLRAEGLDLRERFAELGLAPKQQGRRPSCAVFAVVGALEYQLAEATGRPEQLSEEYLIWATRTTLGLGPGEPRVIGDAGQGADDDDRDAGFTLGEVLAALRVYGVPLRREMPNTFGKGMEAIGSPPEALIGSARQRSGVFVHVVPGAGQADKVANIVHLLNEGVPVVAGLRWPHGRTLRAPLLSRQVPVKGYAHAVTLVGYYIEPQNQAVRFIFRNSWGSGWGAGGYGFVDSGYVTRHLLDAVVLELGRAR